MLHPLARFAATLINYSELHKSTIGSLELYAGSEIRPRALKSAGFKSQG